MSLMLQGLSKPTLAKLNEDYQKIRDVTIATEIEDLLNYLFRILNIKTSSKEEQDNLDFQIPIILDFIKSKFGFLTIPEIKEAFKMYVAKEFQEVKVFRLLDCMIISDVLTAFIEFRNESLRIYEQKKQYIMLEQKNEISEKEQFDIMSDAINKKYNEYLQTKNIQEPFSHIFNELIERGIIKMPTKKTPKLSIYYDNKIQEAKNQLINEFENTSEPDKHKRKRLKEILSDIINNNENLDAKTKIEMRAKKLVLIDFFNNKKELNFEKII